ncbi:MAG: hypothetical protein WAX69_13565, partial [Victivallales bacterium]
MFFQQQHRLSVEIIPRRAMKTGDRNIREESPPGQGRAPARRKSRVAANMMIVKYTLIPFISIRRQKATTQNKFQIPKSKVQTIFK